MGSSSELLKTLQCAVTVTVLVGDLKPWLSLPNSESRLYPLKAEGPAWVWVLGESPW